ncbi:tyrosine-type recombinase/integrase [Maritalea myrionectae]|uniref:tyrosine-type recombinase/integrase n=1 Tax=Maritalea myrionectae TaxID=454601 RepID=UPI0003FA4001|nr:tyrosine-type recombinase/integrase [Maritalea myrionectae]
MGRGRKNYNDPDRFLDQRNGTYYYVRRVPKAAAHLDERGARVRQSLKTKDLAAAREARDVLEVADNHYWASLTDGDDLQRARSALGAAQKRVEALSFSYKPATTLATTASDDELLQRITKLMDVGARPETTDALLGGVETASIRLSELLDFYIAEIAPDEVRDKSKSQFRIWRNIKKKAIDQLVELRGDKAVTEVTREDALAIYRLWRDRVSPRGREPTHTASSGNRVIGTLRRMLGDYHTYIGVAKADYKNPFADLSFKQENERQRPSFSVEWIQTKFLQGDALAGLNSEARAIFLALIDTGARPSEICNLLPEHIQLTHNVPHIIIAPVGARDNYEDRRQIKTDSSKRLVPLVGASLEVFRAHPEGFPHYRDKSSSWSALVNKYLKNNGLVPSEAHTAYCLRHSFEDRMAMAGVDLEVRQRLMGHAIKRPKYGQAGDLAWQREQLEMIVLRS